MIEDLTTIKTIYHWPGQQAYIELYNGTRININGREDVEEILNAAKGANMRISRGHNAGHFVLEQPKPQPVITQPEPKPVCETVEVSEEDETDWYTQHMINKIRTKWGLRNPATGRFMRSSYRERGVNY